MQDKTKDTARVSSDLYPFESRYIKIGGHQLHYVEDGEGDPVVMLHGNPSWSFYYRNLIKRLSPFHHCIVPDHIGMGYSDKPGDVKYSYTLSQRIKDLEEFLDAKNIKENITLILHDWGGIIGMSFACRHPKAIKKIVILNTAAFHLPEGQRFPLFLRFTRTIPGEFFLRAFNSFSIGATRIGVQRTKMSEKIRRAYTAPYGSWKNRIAILRFVQDIPLRQNDPGFDLVTDVQNHLHLFRNTPVLIAWGMKDKVFDKRFLDKWIGYLPCADVHRFEDCGHYILEDAPDEVGQLVLDFLAR
jgi:pimeloyl-ACP methyl ester carboxylesterase